MGVGVVCGRGGLGMIYVMEIIGGKGYMMIGGGRVVEVDGVWDVVDCGRVGGLDWGDGSLLGVGKERGGLEIMIDGDIG